MATTWFGLLALMIALYVVLDGFDLGVGAVHGLLTRTEHEREEALGAIGPVWNGNEVWLIAGGGVLFLAFPRAYAAAFSGLYFGLILVVWLLIGRGLGLELRHQVENPLWRAVCDTVFRLSSALLAVVFGVALGNVIRGVPLGPAGYFHMPLFSILNWYALLVGLLGLVVLVAHGATFLAVNASDELAERSQRWARWLWPAKLVLVGGLIAPTYSVRAQMLTAFADHPWRLVFPVVALGALVAELAWQRAGEWFRAFLASCIFIAGLLATAAAGLYPSILPAREHRPFGLTVDNAASSHHALAIALIWWPIGIALAIVYFAVAYRLFFRRRVSERRRVAAHG